MLEPRLGFFFYNTLYTVQLPSFSYQSLGSISHSFMVFIYSNTAMKGREEKALSEESIQDEKTGRIQKENLEERNIGSADPQHQEQGASSLQRG